MMHNSDVVLTISTEKNKKISEHKFVKKDFRTNSCEVYIPFDSEYSINVKNNKNKRIMLVIKIDGAIVSGNGIVITPNTTDNIDRFVNTPNKFKFVRANSQAVADPTNEENGKLSIEVYTEMMPLSNNFHSYGGYSPFSEYPWHIPTHQIWPTASRDGITLQGNTCNASYCASMGHVTSESLLCGMKIGAQTLQPEAGATVEGGVSKQTFNTTQWLGSELNSMAFEFYLKSEAALATNPEYIKYLELQAKFGKM